LGRGGVEAAPCAIGDGGSIRLCWHSDFGTPNDKRRSRIWLGAFDPTADPIILSPELAVDSFSFDEEPALCKHSDGTERLLFRSQRRALTYQSRTVDTRNPELLSQLGTIEDRAHYTYDCGPPVEPPRFSTSGDDPPEDADAHWYAGNAVGLFFPASTEKATTVREQVQRMRAFVEPFRPEHVRFVWQMPLFMPAEDEVGEATDSTTAAFMAWLHTHPELGSTVDTTTDPIDLRRRLYDAFIDRMSRS
jgi:hypothetical protein